MMIRDIFKKLQRVWSFSRNLIRNDVLQPLGTVKGTVKPSSFIENNKDYTFETVYEKTTSPSLVP